MDLKVDDVIRLNYPCFDRQITSYFLKTMKRDNSDTDIKLARSDCPQNWILKLDIYTYSPSGFLLTGFLLTSGFLLTLFWPSENATKTLPQEIQNFFPEKIFMSYLFSKFCTDINAFDQTIWIIFDPYHHFDSQFGSFSVLVLGGRWLRRNGPRDSGLEIQTLYV